MDTQRRLKILSNDRGVTLVYIALMITVLLAFVGLAVDLGYMYVAKGQLQNAADSAALAGASQLKDGSDTIQTGARGEAEKFAATNIAAINSVSISSDNTNLLNKDNDITVGNWDPARSLEERYKPGQQPINAIQVRSRRTGSTDAVGLSKDGQVDLFLSKVFGWAKMSASAEAIAQRAARAGAYFMIGKSVCSQTISPSSPYTLSVDSQNSGNMAWTSLLSVPTAKGLNVQDLICGYVVPSIDVCGKELYTTQGVSDSVYKDMEAAFYDPYYDEKNKSIYIGDKGNKIVSKWTIIVPIADIDNPAKQSEPVKVYGYAKITLIKACGSGAGKPCNEKSRQYFAPSDGKTKVCDGNEKDIVIESIECKDCDHSGDILGATTVLVK